MNPKHSGCPFDPNGPPLTRAKVIRICREHGGPGERTIDKLISTRVWPVEQPGERWQYIRQRHIYDWWVGKHLADPAPVHCFPADEDESEIPRRRSHAMGAVDRHLEAREQRG
jgi:hypothetical protein